MFELRIGLPEIIEQLSVVGLFRGRFLQQLYGLRIVAAPIVENTKNPGDIRLVRIGATGSAGEIIGFDFIGRTLAVEQGDAT